MFQTIRVEKIDVPFYCLLYISCDNLAFRYYFDQDKKHKSWKHSTAHLWKIWVFVHYYLSFSYDDRERHLQMSFYNVFSVTTLFCAKLAYLIIVVIYIYICISQSFQSFSTVLLIATQWIATRSDLLVHHQPPEFTQTHVHWVSDIMQPSHSLSSPSPPTFNISQNQDLFQSISSLHQLAKVMELQLQNQSLQWIFRTDFL